MLFGSLRVKLLQVVAVVVVVVLPFKDERIPNNPPPLLMNTHHYIIKHANLPILLVCLRYIFYAALGFI